VQLRDDQVTNNLRIARQVAGAAAAAQAARRQAPQPLLPTPSRVAAERDVANPSAPSAPPVAPRPTVSPTNPLSGGVKLGAGTGIADPETANRRNVKVDRSGRQYWRDSRGNIRYDF
jgi:hypothetical protein